MQNYLTLYLGNQYTYLISQQIVTHEIILSWSDIYSS